MVDVAAGATADGSLQLTRPVPLPHGDDLHEREPASPRAAPSTVVRWDEAFPFTPSAGEGVRRPRDPELVGLHDPRRLAAHAGQRPGGRRLGAQLRGRLRQHRQAQVRDREGDGARTGPSPTASRSRSAISPSPRANRSPPIRTRSRRPPGSSSRPPACAGSRTARSRCRLFRCTTRRRSPRSRPTAPAAHAADDCDDARASRRRTLSAGCTKQQAEIAEARHLSSRARRGHGAAGPPKTLDRGHRSGRCRSLAHAARDQHPGRDRVLTSAPTDADCPDGRQHLRAAEPVPARRDGAGRSERPRRHPQGRAGREGQGRARARRQGVRPVHRAAERRLGDGDHQPQEPRLDRHQRPLRLGRLPGLLPRPRDPQGLPGHRALEGASRSRRRSPPSSSS